MKTIIVFVALMGFALALPAQTTKPGVPPPPPKPVRVEKDDLKTDETVYLASAYAGLPAYSAYGSLPGAALPAYPAYSAYSGLPAIQPIGAPIAYYG